ncbi:hypothetical protein Bca4012_049497 [Brassica carinata]
MILHIEIIKCLLHSNPLNIGAVSNPSNGWESIIAASPILQHELRKTIGNDLELGNASRVCRRILSIRISKTGRRDCFCWDHTKSRLYSVKSGYSVAHDMRRNNTYAPVLEPSSTRLKKAVWKLKAPRKLKHFLWQALSRYLATAEKLKSRHCTRDSSCVRSGAEVESINHTLFESPPGPPMLGAIPCPHSSGVFPVSISICES